MDIKLSNGVSVRITDPQKQKAIQKIIFNSNIDPEPKAKPEKKKKKNNRRWTSEDRGLLISLHKENADLATMSEKLDRHPGPIKLELYRLRKTGQIK